MRARRKGNPAGCITRLRLYPRGATGFDSQRAFERLCAALGRCAATTYAVRRRNGYAIGVALELAREQVARGVHEGSDCHAFRMGPPQAVLALPGGWRSAAS